MLFTIASKRSSCDRNALRTCHTTLNRLLSANAADGSTPSGTATGKMTYP
ncbi:Uncharacterised protein [Mycobacterium tuberculosis]|nr:Uncharacterised protein [Mycobacterium tuberculosis]CKR26443.1 Uncharacterised protein [Mycobacterium tuberculosis]CNV53551.1 Uncharacterised protein [Mycobacterium tuberculosis]CNW27369.1 Uncharacterised protein [Mycobacterium tuberculosis]